MYFLITIKNTGDHHEYMRAVNNFLNGYRVLESYVGSDHSHILIQTNILPDVQLYSRYYRCYIHFRRVRETRQDVERVKEYIRKHRVGVCGSMDVGHIKVWVKKRDDGKVVMTLQMPEWYDLSGNRAVITWTEQEFWQFVGYIAGEVAKQNSEEKQYGKGSGGKYTGGKSGGRFKRYKGFSKAVKGDKKR